MVDMRHELNFFMYWRALWAAVPMLWSPCPGPISEISMLCGRSLRILPRTRPHAIVALRATRLDRYATGRSCYSVFRCGLAVWKALNKQFAKECWAFWPIIFGMSSSVINLAWHVQLQFSGILWTPLQVTFTIERASRTLTKRFFRSSGHLDGGWGAYLPYSSPCCSSLVSFETIVGCSFLRYLPTWECC